MQNIIFLIRKSWTHSSFSHFRYKIDKSIIRSTIESQLTLSLRVRTVQPTGNLMFAIGKVDYSILEIVNGGVQYKFDLGSGEGLVRASTIYVSDGQWHEVKLERFGNNARLEIDGGKHSSHGSAPGVNKILNLQSDDMYLGAEVRQLSAIKGIEDVQRGFIGCMDDVRIAKSTLPLHMNGGNNAIVLKRFANVEFSCDENTALVAIGICGSQPCQNGGTCREIDGSNVECDCHGRFSGIVCEFDTDPCASSPCLYGGKCEVVMDGGDFYCNCVGSSLSGKRCEFGRYCSPNPCLYGGRCEEGNNGPICECISGFTGERCEIDVDECNTTNPCLNGGTCLNNNGGYRLVAFLQHVRKQQSKLAKSILYRCICPNHMTGDNCSGSVLSIPIFSTPHFTITLEQLIWIGTAIVANIFFVIVYVSCRKVRSKRTRARANNINNETRKQIVLNSARSHDHEFKRSSKLSNLEVIQVRRRGVSVLSDALQHAFFSYRNSFLLESNKRVWISLQRQSVTR